LGDGKIPVHAKWAKKIRKNKVAIDSLLNQAGLASFTRDQQALDDRVRGIIK
jgi:transaldolase